MGSAGLRDRILLFGGTVTLKNTSQNEHLRTKHRGKARIFYESMLSVCCEMTLLKYNIAKTQRKIAIPMYFFVEHRSGDRMPRR